MLQAQSLVILFALVALGFSPMIYRASVRKDAEDSRYYMSGREAAARHLFGEAHDWDPFEMSMYDHHPEVHDRWLRLADQRIAEQQ